MGEASIRWVGRRRFGGIRQEPELLERGGAGEGLGEKEEEAEGDCSRAS